MKNRVLFIIVSVILMLTMLHTVTASALMIGDANGDGFHTASDARFTLRCSVDLESPSEEQIKALDIIKDGKLTAADARMILRASVELEVLHECEFIENAEKSKSATCTAEGTKVLACTGCEKEQTEVIPVTAHNFNEGSCSVCGAEDPDYVAGVTVWLPKSGKRFHYVSDCSGMKDPRQSTETEAIRQGFTACPNCVY